MNILSLFVIIPLIMMAIIFCIDGEKKSLIRIVMSIGGLALLATSSYLTVEYLALREAGDMSEFLFTDSYLWYETFNIHYAIGVDGVSVAMLLLSSIVVITGVFVSYSIEEQAKEYFLWFLLLSIGVYGFFISLDLFTMFLFYEVALIPMYLLIGLWGSGKKEYSAMKLTLMLMGGSAFLMVGIFGIYYQSVPEGGTLTFNIQEIAANVTALKEQGADNQWQYIFFPLTFVGFGVLGAMFPFHTWSPDGHASAPTAVSMLHAGVLMKLGGYGCFRVAMYLMPDAAND
ncbi:MAG: NADH-quinone oxidoreductase subunit M, partial [Paludibacteraceae bacterium]|nr:NADH-quinone oxidoreductase subunit M [Paludibacteraceae bacterium]